MKQLSLVLIALGLVAVFSACATMPELFSEGPPLVAPAVPPIDAFVVERGVVENLHLLTGTLRILSQPLTFDINNVRIGQIFVSPGDMVVAGQNIARIDVTHLEEQIQNQQREVNRLTNLHNLEQERSALALDILMMEYSTAMQNAASTLNAAHIDRAEALREEVEWAQLLREQSAQSSAAAIAGAQRRLDELRGGLEGIYLTSPIDGVITNLNASEGDISRRTSYIAFVAEVGQRPFIEYTGHQIGLRGIREAERLRASIDGQSFDVSLMELTPGQIAYYSQRSVMQFGDHRTPIRFEILADEGDIPPLGANVTIALYTVWYPDILRIPSNAFFLHHPEDPFTLPFTLYEAEGPFGPYVLRVEADGRLTNVPVTATYTQTFVAIHDGLTEGDVIFVRP